MTVMTFAQVYQLARDSGGLGSSAAVIATAIAAAESGHDTQAVGDLKIQTATWGPSVGLWQVRSLKADTGTGKSRDVNKLMDPVFNARAMASISGGGMNWSPWSAYTNGSYKKFLAQAKNAAGSNPSAPSVTYTSPGGATQTGFDFDIDPFGGTGLPGPFDDLGKKAIGGAADAANPIPELIGGIKDVVPYAAALWLGVMLISVGAWRTAT